jgi:hypothetical protein
MSKENDKKTGGLVIGSQDMLWGGWVNHGAVTECAK